MEDTGVSLGEAAAAKEELLERIHDLLYDDPKILAMAAEAVAEVMDPEYAGFDPEAHELYLKYYAKYQALALEIEEKHAAAGLLVPADRHFGRADEVLAQVEAGANPVGIGEPVGVGLFLLAREYLPQWEGWPAGELTIFEQAGVSHQEAYDARDALQERILDLLWDPDYDPSVFSSSLKELTVTISDYFTENPDCWSQGKPRFLRFLVDLMEPGKPGAGMTFHQLSELTGLPLEELEQTAQPGLKKCPSYTG